MTLFPYALPLSLLVTVVRDHNHTSFFGFTFWCHVGYYTVESSGGISQHSGRLMIGGWRARFLAEAVGDFTSSGFTFFLLTLVTLVSVTLPHPRVTAVARESPGHSANRNRMLSVSTPFTHRCRSGLTLLSRHNVGLSQGNKFTHKL